MQTSFACAFGENQQPEPAPWQSFTSALRPSAVRLVAVRPPPLPIAGCKITDERTGEIHDYTRRVA
jgi:hypothetical protein